MTDICMSCCNINPDNYACVTEKKKKNQTKNEKNMKKETMIIWKDSRENHKIFSKRKT